SHFGSRKICLFLPVKTPGMMTAPLHFRRGIPGVRAPAPSVRCSEESTPSAAKRRIAQVGGVRQPTEDIPGFHSPLPAAAKFGPTLAAWISTVKEREVAIADLLELSAQHPEHLYLLIFTYRALEALDAETQGGTILFARLCAYTARCGGWRDARHLM